MPFSILQPMVAEFHPTRTNRDTAGQIRTALAARPKVATKYAIFGRAATAVRICPALSEIVRVE